MQVWSTAILGNWGTREGPAKDTKDKCVFPPHKQHRVAALPPEKTWPRLDMGEVFKFKNEERLQLTINH